MRRAGLLFLVTVLVGAVVFVVLGALRQSDDAFSLNVPVIGIAAELPPGSTFCQSQLDVPIGGTFDGGRLKLGTERRPGPRLQVLLADDQGRPIARATVPGGYADNSSPRFRFGREIKSGRGLQLCYTNDGDVPVFPYGSGGDPNPSTTFTLDGQGLPVDVAVVFERPSRSSLAAAGDMLERATLFRTPRLSAALYGVLLLLLFA
ncbi:MAG: hypothetical protein WC558_04725, partial [Patulibacter sp.]